MTVSQLLASMDAAELVEWQAFFRLEAEERDHPQPPEVVSENLKLLLGK